MKPTTKKIVIALVVILILWGVYKLYSKRDSSNELEPSSNTNEYTQVSTAPITSTNYTNSTVFSVKSPLMEDKRVSWIQYEYNRLVGVAKSHGVPGNWFTITQDGVYGNQTKQAVNSLLGKTSASYNEVKNKVDQSVTTIESNY